VHALFSTHTHTFYKVFQISQILASYFGGNSVTHYFGHPHDESTRLCSGSQNNLLHEENH
jgi:hypothetical protein